MEFGSLVVNFHSTDGVSCHDSSTIEFCSSVFHFAAGDTAKTLPFSAISKSLICFTLPAPKFSVQKDLRKIFQPGACYTQHYSRPMLTSHKRNCSEATRKTRMATTDHESPPTAFCISCAPLWTICHPAFPGQLSHSRNSRPVRGVETSMKSFSIRIDPQFRAGHFPQLHQKY